MGQCAQGAQAFRFGTCHKLQVPKISINHCAKRCNFFLHHWTRKHDTKLMANFCSSSIKRNNRQKSDLIKYILYAEQSSVNDHFHRVGDGAIITIISLLSTAISRREKNALEKRIQRVGCMWKENSVRIKEALPHLWSVMMMPNEIVYGLAKRRCQKIIHDNYMKFHHNEPGHTVGSIAPSFYLLNTKHSFRVLLFSPVDILVVVSFDMIFMRLLESCTLEIALR